MAVPVKFKKDGSLAASSKAVDGSDFAVLSRYAGEKVKELHERIASGEARSVPTGREPGPDAITVPTGIYADSIQRFRLPLP